MTTAPEEIIPHREIVRELNAAVDRLKATMPQVDGEHTMHLCICYFADLYAKHFGHAAAVTTLTEIARRGVKNAAEELAATRN